LDRITKDEIYTSSVDEDSVDGVEVLLKNMVDKINEIIDWINSQ
tara:strand:+ start:671 stop:802 length:132 start_codon:yes stop_codon:yes gene_type:complete